MAEPSAHRASRQVRDALADERDRKPHLADAHLEACERVAVGEHDWPQRLQLGVDPVRTVTPEVPVDARRAEHRAGDAVLLRDVSGDRADADGPLEEDLVSFEDAHVVSLDAVREAIQEPLELPEPALRQVVEHAPRAVIVEVHARATDFLEHVEDLFAVA